MAFKDFVSCVNFGMSIAALVYIVNIYSDTKEDPFNVVLQNKDSYFKNLTQIYSKNVKQCKCGEEIVNDFCSEEQKLLGCIDLSDFSLNIQSDKNKFLRYLIDSSKCKEYEQKIRATEKLNQVFDINASGIHSMATGLLVLIVVNFALVILIITVSCIVVCCGEKMILCIVFIPCFVYAGYAAGITNLVLFIILCVQYYGGATRDFIDFLECSNINQEKFKNEFKIVQDLRTDFIVFLVLNIIYLILSVITNATSNKKKK